MHSFGTKGETLQLLRGKFDCALVKELEVVPYEAWAKSPEQVLEKFSFKDTFLIVRSSALGEDSHVESKAGQYLTVSNIQAGNHEALRKAIDEVFESYGSPRPGDQVVVQEQVPNILISGVLFTADIDTLAPYYIANYDDHTGSHDSITSGRGGKLKTYVRAKCSPSPVRDERLAELFDVAHRMEKFFGNESLDIEFAIDQNGRLFILQVRPIVVRGKHYDQRAKNLDHYLLKIRLKTEKLNGPHPGLCGNRGFYSVMTDWNPAEIIGTRPQALALTLYRELVTNDVWAFQRHDYGYRDLRNYPLLVSFIGQPYIDVRLSFNSFIPKEIDEDLAGRLVDYYTRSVSENPSEHDKVEFNVVYSCYYLDLSRRIKDLLCAGFSELDVDRLKFALLNLTNRIISPSHGHYQQDLARLELLEKRYADIMKSSLPTIDKIYWLIQDCKRYGTLPFAGLARAGFIAVQFLRSFVALEIITEDELHAYMHSLNTVASQLSNHVEKLGNGSLSKKEFLERYGHLRPGTYDINSLTYAEAFDEYFPSSLQEDKKPSDAIRSFEFSAKQREKIELHLHQNGLTISTEELLCFISEAIEGREFGKFVFTRHLSAILSAVEKLGKRAEIPKEEMAFVNIGSILGLYSTLDHRDLREIFLADIETNREVHDISKFVRLPQVIQDPNDVYDFFLDEVEPNYVTLKRVTNIIVTEENLLDCDLAGKVLLIKSADPGYDWIFSRNIAGIITMYGGANSHMAIRCAELQIPAVIGCGEVNFEQWSKANILEIDCVKKRVRAVS